MEIYTTEEQQAEAIKDWWKENGKPVILGAAIGLIGMFGWRYFNEYRQHQMELGAVAYDAVLKDLTANKEKAFEQVEAFIQDHKSDSYGDLASLQLAAAAVKAGKLDLAVTQLQRVAEQGSSDVAKPLANLRLARVLLEQGKAEEALKRLDNIKPESYKAMVSEIRGDIYLTQGDKVKALAAYQAAADASQQVGPELRIKLDDLAIPKMPVNTEEKPHA